MGEHFWGFLGGTIHRVVLRSSGMVLGLQGSMWNGFGALERLDWFRGRLGGSL